MRGIKKRVTAAALAVLMCAGLIFSDAATAFAQAGNGEAVATEVVAEAVTTEEAAIEDGAAEESTTEETTSEEAATEETSEVESTTETESNTEETSTEATTEETTEVQTTEATTETTETVTTEEPLKDQSVKTGALGATGSCVLGIDENGVLKVESGNKSDLTGQVTIPAGTKVIPTGIFNENSNITNLVFEEPDDLEKIEKNAFSNSGIIQFKIPKNVVTIEEYAFSNASKLETVVFGDETNSQMVTVGKYAFLACASLQTVKTNNRLKSIGEGAFKECISLDVKAGDLNLAATESIGVSAFEHCTSLTNIKLPESAAYTTIEKWTFKGCTALGQGSSNVQDENAVKIGSNVTTVADWAFEGCTGLTYVIFPEKVASIGHEIMNGCTKLRQLRFENKADEGSCKTTVSYDSFPFKKGLIFASFGGTIQEWVGDHITQYGVVYQSLYSENTITVSSASHAKVTLSTQKARAGVKIYLTIKPDSGYVLNTDETKLVTGYGEDKTFIDYTDTSFIMPDTYVNVFVVCVPTADVEMGDKLRLKSLEELIIPSGEQESAIQYDLGTNTITFSKPGKYATLNVVGSKKNYRPIYSDLTFTSSNTGVATVDQNGVVRAVKGGTQSQPAKAVITVSLTKNPNGVQPLKVNVSVGPKTFVETLTLDYTMDKRATIQKAEAAGTEANEMGYDLIQIRTSILNAQTNTITVSPKGLDAAGDELHVPYTWSVLDSKIASLAATQTKGDSNTITLKQGVTGETVVTVKTNNVDKGENAEEKERRFIIRIVDDTPRLSETAVTVDPSSDTGTQLELVANYGYVPETTNLEIVQKSGQTFTDDKIVGKFTVTVADDIVYLKANNPEDYQANRKTVIKGCYLQGTLSESKKPFQIALDSITICKKDIKPAMSVSGRLNLFYNGLATEKEIGKITVLPRNKDLTIESVILTDDKNGTMGGFSNNFTITTAVDKDGKLYITRKANDTPLTLYDSGSKDGKPVTSGYMKIYYKGYASAFYYPVSVSYSVSAPSYTVNPGRVTLNKYAQDQTTQIQLINRSTRKAEDFTENTKITVDSSRDSGTNVNIHDIENTDMDVAADTLTVRFNGSITKSGRVVLNLMQPSWEATKEWNKKGYVKAVLNVTSIGTTPRASLKKTTLLLNSYCADVSDSATMSLNQKDAVLADTQTFTPVGRIQDENLTVIWDGSKVIASIAEGQTVKNGNYRFECIPDFTYDNVTDVYQAAKVTVTVKVVNVQPSLVVKTRSLSLNSYAFDADGKHDLAVTAFTWSNLPQEYTGYDFDTTGLTVAVTRGTNTLGLTGDQFTFDMQQRTITVVPAKKAEGTITYQLSGLKLTKEGQEIEIKPFTITIRMKNTEPSVRVNAKGSLNPLDPASSVTYTPVISGISGKVSAVTFKELDASNQIITDADQVHFVVSQPDPSTGASTIMVRDGKTLENRSYRLQLTYELTNADGSYAVSRDQVITPRQALPAVKADCSSVKLFAGNKSKTASFTLTKSTNKTVPIDSIILSDRTANYKVLKEAIDTISYNDATGVVTLKLKNSALFTQNKAQTLILETHSTGQLAKTRGTTFNMKVTVVK